MKAGDAIAAVTHATGLDKLAEKAAEANGKSNCGCTKSKALYNNGEYIEGTKQLAKNAVDLANGVTKMLVRPAMYSGKVGVPYRLNVQGFHVDGSIPGVVADGDYLAGIPTTAGEFELSLTKGPIHRKATIRIGS